MYISSILKSNKFEKQITQQTEKFNFSSWLWIYVYIYIEYFFYLKVDCTKAKDWGLCYEREKAGVC